MSRSPPETEGLIDAALLSRLPPRAIVVNTSRGEIVDQGGAARRAGSGALAGAALDVLVSEPAPFSPGCCARIRRAWRPAAGDSPYRRLHPELLEAVETYITGIFLQAVDAQA